MARRTRRWTLVVVAAAVVLGGCGSCGRAARRPGDPPVAPVLACSSDAECTRIEVKDCCGRSSFTCASAAVPMQEVVAAHRKAEACETKKVDCSGSTTGIPPDVSCVCIRGACAADPK